MASCAWIDTHGHVPPFAKTQFREQMEVHEMAWPHCTLVHMVRSLT